MMSSKKMGCQKMMKVTRSTVRTRNRRIAGASKRDRTARVLEESVNMSASTGPTVIDAVDNR